MDIPTLFLAVVLAGLSLILAATGGAAAARFGDVRLASVSAALGLIALVGVLAVVNQVSPRYGPPFAVAPVPIGILVLAVVLLYVAVVRGVPRTTVE